MKNYMLLLFICLSCKQKIETLPGGYPANTFTAQPVVRDSTLQEKIVAFAKTQIGVQYKYCSMDPKMGFDCSGFVNYVFDHFHVKVPRSSVEFTHEGEDVALGNARPGDLILFTGTAKDARSVGHIGIITANDNGNISFIHSSSGTANSVVISPLAGYYTSRFIKVIRVAK